MKKKFVVLAILALIVLPTAFAASQNYMSYLVLPPNVQLEGSNRSYDYSKHKITITVDRIPAPSEPKQLVISINKKNLIGSTQKKVTTVPYSLYRTIDVEMGSHGKGKYWYGFGSFQNALTDGNSGHGYIYAGIESDSVVMTSYN